MKCWNCGRECSEGTKFCARCGSDLMKAADKKADKKKIGVWVFFGAAAVLFIAVIVAVLLSGTGRKNYDKQMVYIQDGMIYYMENMDSDKEPFCVAEIKNADELNLFTGAGVRTVYEYNKDSEIHAKLTISNDHQYIYFYSKLADAGYGTLNRILISKVRKNASANKDNIQKIADKVMDAVVLDDGTAFCIKESGSLVYWNGDSEEEIADNGTDLFIMNNQEKILYLEAGNSGAKALCSYDIANNESQELAEEVSRAYCTQEGAYYTVSEAHEETLYDFVEDKCEEKDSFYRNATLRDYLVPVTMEEALSKEDYEFLEENPDAWTDFYEYMEYDAQEDLYYYIQFADDMAMGMYAYDKQKDQWYGIDKDLILELSENIADFAGREETREELKAEAYTYFTYDLYYVDLSGKSQLLAENVNEVTLRVESKNSFVAYQLRERPQISLELDDVNGCDTVRIALDAEASTEVTDEELNYLIGTREVDLDLDVRNISQITASENTAEMLLYCNYDYDYETNEKSAVLFRVSISGDTLGEPERIAEVISEGKWMGDTYYFSNNLNILYKYEAGEKQRVSKNVAFAAVCEDGNILMFDKKTAPKQIMYLYNTAGDKEEIGEAIWLFDYVDENRIGYLTDDTLYIYRGNGESVKIDKNVQYFYCLGGKKMESVTM